MGRAGWKATLPRLAWAVPGAFRRDPVFRYAAIGAVVALLVLLVRLGGSDPADSGAVPQALPAPAALGSTYGQTGASPPSPVPSAASPPPRIAPGRSLDAVRAVPDSTTPDRFGTLPSVRREKP